MRLSLFTALFVLSFGLQAQQLLNADFEHWEDYTKAKHWNSINDLIVMPGLLGFQQSSDAHTGQYAAMITTISEFGMTIPGVLTKGTVTMGNVEGGIPFAFRPERLKAYYKHPTNGNAQIHLLLTKFENGIRDTIASGHFYPASNVDSYTLMDMDILYYSNEIPDSLNIVLLSDDQNVGDTLLVDDFQFVYPTSISISTDKPSLVVYPNPSKGVFYLKEESKSDVCIYSLQGQKVAVYPKGTKRMDLGLLPKGFYLLETEGGVCRSKLQII